MAETWEDLVTPVRRDENAMANYGQGYVSPALNSGDGEIYDTSNVLARMPQDTALTRGLRGAANFVRSESQPDNIIAGGLDSAANWMDWSPQVGPDTLAPLGGAAIGTLASPRNAVGIFGGRLAQTADQAALRRAEEMAATGADRRAIWDETGWFKGPDGQWRFEIDDSAARVAPSLAESFERGGGGLVRQGETVGGGFSHPNFMAAYPDAASLGYEVRRMEGPGGGSYAQPQSGMPEGRVLARNSNLEGARSTTLHELQHDVQGREDFGRGSSPARVRSQPEWQEEMRRIAERRGRQPSDERGWTTIDPIGEGQLGNMVADDLYRRHVGEVEARNVQTRQDMTADERRARPPWETQDIADENQIIRRDASEQHSAAAPPSGMGLDQVLEMLKRYNLPVERVQTASTGTRYVRVRDPNGGDPVTIRIPSDTHLGNPDRAGPPGQFFDTGSQRQSPGRTRFRGGAVANEGGERFANPEALEAALKWRFPNQVARTGENFLVRPDQAPAGAGREAQQSPPRPSEGADFSPDQPRLLSVAAPAGAGWTATVTKEPPEMAARENEDQGNAGRFAAPLVSPDAQLAADTRSLSDRVSVATRNVESDFDWSDLVVPVTQHAMAGLRRASNAMAGY